MNNLNNNVSHSLVAGPGGCNEQFKLTKPKESLMMKSAKIVATKANEFLTKPGVKETAVSFQKNAFSQLNLFE